MGFNSQTAAQAGRKSKRPKDKHLAELRSHFKELLTDNKENLSNWLAEVAKDDPAKAIELFLRISSFVISKPRTYELKTDSSTDLNLIKVPEWMKPKE